MPESSNLSKKRDHGKGMSSSSLKKLSKKATKKLNQIDSKTRAKDILDTFQNHHLSPDEWDALTDQQLPRWVQKAAEKNGIRKNPEKGDENLTRHRGLPTSQCRRKATSEGVHGQQIGTKNHENRGPSETFR